MYSWWAAIQKALQHKYLRRYKKNGKWRYVYAENKGNRHSKSVVIDKIKTIGADEEIHAGSSFSAGADKGHLVVSEVKDNQVSFYSDDIDGKGTKGKKETLSIADFKARISASHAEAFRRHAEEGHAKRKEVLAEAKQYGTPRQIERAKAEVARWEKLHGISPAETARPSLKDRLLKEGGRHWKGSSGGAERIYLSNDQFEEALGAVFTYDRKGEPNGVKIDGSHISNTKARGIIRSAPYWDVKAQKWGTQNQLDKDWLEQIKDHYGDDYAPSEMEPKKEPEPAQTLAPERVPPTAPSYTPISVEKLPELIPKGGGMAGVSRAVRAREIRAAALPKIRDLGDRVVAKFGDKGTAATVSAIMTELERQDSAAWWYGKKTDLLGSDDQGGEKDAAGKLFDLAKLLPQESQDRIKAVAKAAQQEPIQKALQHKYLRKFRKNGKWVYVYAEGKGGRHGADHQVAARHNKVEDHHIHEGASFSAGAGRGHIKIISVSKGRVTFRHDDTDGKGKKGDVKQAHIDDFKKHIEGHHADATKRHAASGLEKRTDILAEAKQYGTPKQIARAEKELARWREMHKEQLPAIKEADSDTNTASLPNLKGSEKQVNWANAIRNTSLSRIRAWAKEFGSKLDDTSKKGLEQLIPFFEKQASASWWIDNRADLQGMDVAGFTKNLGPVLAPSHKEASAKIKSAYMALPKADRTAYEKLIAENAKGEAKQEKAKQEAEKAKQAAVKEKQEAEKAKQEAERLDKIAASPDGWKEHLRDRGIDPDHPYLQENAEKAQEMWDRWGFAMQPPDRPFDSKDGHEKLWEIMNKDMEHFMGGVETKAARDLVARSGLTFSLEKNIPLSKEHAESIGFDSAGGVYRSGEKHLEVCADTGAKAQHTFLHEFAHALDHLSGGKQGFLSKGGSVELKKHLDALPDALMVGVSKENASYYKSDVERVARAMEQFLPTVGISASANLTKKNGYYTHAQLREHADTFAAIAKEIGLPVKPEALARFKDKAAHQASVAMKGSLAMPTTLEHVRAKEAGHEWISKARSYLVEGKHSHAIAAVERAKKEHGGKGMDNPWDEAHREIKIDGKAYAKIGAKDIKAAHKEISL